MEFGYFRLIRNLLDQVENTQAAVINAAAERVADCIASGGVLHIFGTGHGHMLAEELFYRAGGLAPIDAMLVPGLMLHESALASTLLERTPGYAAILLDQYDLRPGEVMLIASNSGRNAVPVEAALDAKRRGLTVIALTSLQHSRSVPSRHSSGLRLFELADIVIDNCGVLGDAGLEVPGLVGRTGATSTIIGAAILNTLVSEVMALLIARGVEPPALFSANAPGGDEHNESVLASYRLRLRHL